MHPETFCIKSVGYNSRVSVAYSDLGQSPGFGLVDLYARNNSLWLLDFSVVSDSIDTYYPGLTRFSELPSLFTIKNRNAFVTFARDRTTLKNMSGQTRHVVRHVSMLYNHVAIHVSSTFMYMY